MLENQRQQQQKDVVASSSMINSTTVDKVVFADCLSLSHLQIVMMHDEPLEMLRLIDENASNNINGISIDNVAACGEGAFPDLRFVLPIQSPPSKKKRQKIDLNIMDTVLDCLHRRT
jgi:hypothetical protein